MSSSEDQAGQSRGMTKARLGHDLGSLHSKLALAFVGSDQQPHLSRVPFSGMDDDPDAPDENTSTDFEFVAVGAKNDAGAWFEGTQTLSRDVYIPLKTMLVYLALLSIRSKYLQQIVEILPRGPDLLVAVNQQAGALTPDIIKRLLREHFSRLRRQALAQAARTKVEIAILAITYPNYLFENSNSLQFDAYVDCYLESLLAVWGNIKYRVVSEGQAAGIYICQPFVDSISGVVQKQVTQLFEVLNKNNWVDLLVVDSGGSSVNIQSMCVWFENGQMSCSESWAVPGQPSGTQSGSQIANDEVKKIIVQTLEFAKRNPGFTIRDGDVALYLQNFDRQKRSKRFSHAEYIRQGKQLNLYNDGSCTLRIDLSPAQLQKVFGKAYNRGVRCVQDAVSNSLIGENDIAVLFTGGSYQSLGLKEELEGVMKTFKRELDKKKSKKTINWAFLGRAERQWSTVVASGAALGVMTMPPLAELVPHLTIGIQKVRRTTDRSGKSEWVGDPTARVLFSNGNGQPRAAFFDIPAGAPKSNRLRFKLVADPLYHVDRSAEELAELPDIEIAEPRLPDDDSPPPYDLGCQLSARNFPTGRVRFSLGGRRLQALLEGDVSAIVDDELPLVLSCIRINARGQPAKKPDDTRYVLPLKPDPGSRFPIIGQERNFVEGAVPVWCSGCRDEIEGPQARMCQECRFNLCRGCAVHYDAGSGLFQHSKHPAKHEMKPVTLEH